ncbi:sulfatase family protein [Pirellulimonas nuda]|nr:arylsulfatase [Pirellulimonas nuda]
MRIIVLAICLAVPAGLCAADAPPPNVVYVLADDLGYGDVRCLNPERGKIETPHIDRLAGQGIVFTDAHSGSSVCTPTRYGVLTGRYAWRTRLQKGVLDGFPEPLIAADRLTVGKLLQAQGYRTACIGKWHLGFTIENSAGAKKAAGASAPAPVGAITQNGPLTRGFDEYLGFQHARSMDSLFVADRVTKSVDPVDVLPLLAAEARAFVSRQAERRQPFFLYFALNSPHTPIVPSAPWRGKSGLGDHGDYVMETDWAVGEVLAAIDEAGVGGDTLVVFSSDNGCSKAANITQLQTQGHYPSASMRGSKADIFDGGHRVPLIARWPGHIKLGSRSDQLVCLTDLIATCAELCGVVLPDTAGEDSISMLPALLGTGAAPRHESVVHHSINGSFAIRQGPWKLELCADSGGWSDPKPGSKAAVRLPQAQLYNLQADIGETNNVLAQHPKVVERLTASLEQIVSNGRSTAGAPQANDVAIRIRKGPATPAKQKYAPSS